MTNSEEILIRVGVDSSAVGAGLRKAKVEFEEFGHEVVNKLGERFAELFAANELKESVEQAIQFGAEIKQTAERLGVGVVAAQEFSFAAGQTGLELSNAAKAMDELTSKLSTLKSGGEAAKKIEESFKALGISVEELKGKTPEEVFRLLSENWEKMGVGLENSNAMLEIFGAKLGTKLIPLMKEFGENAKKLHESGNILNKNDIKSLDDYEKASKRLGLTWKIVVADIVVGLGNAKDAISAAFGPAGSATNIGYLEDRLDKQKKAKDVAAALLAGSQQPELSEKDQERIKTNNAKAAEKEAEAKKKELSAKAEISKLEEERRSIALELAHHAGTEMELSEKRVKLAEKDLEIAGKKKAYEKEQADLADRIAKAKEKVSYEEGLASDRKFSKFRMTADELAESGQWVRSNWSGKWSFQQNENERTAAERKRVIARGKYDLNNYGDEDYRTINDFKEYDRLTGILEKNHELSPQEQMNKSLDDSKKALEQLLAKAGGANGKPGLDVNIANTN